MARKATEIEVLPPPDVTAEDVVRGDLQAFDAHAAEVEQQHSAARVVAVRIGYQLPGDSTDPDLIQRDIAANMRRSVEACLEVGRGLAVLKEVCGHGNFIARLDVLGLDRTVAVRFMQAATKFSNVATSHHLTKAIGTQSKLLEMLVLDDEQVEELELTGQTGELKLDDIATMSVKELRTALRELREQQGANDRLMSTKNAKIDELERRLDKVERGALPVAERIEPVMDELATFSKRVDIELRNLAVIFAAVEEIAGGEADKPDDAADMNAVLPLVQRMRDAIGRAATASARLQFEFDERLQHYIGAAEMFAPEPVVDGDAQA